MAKHAATVTSDARNRSLRTFAQCLALGVVLAGAATGLAEIEAWRGDEVLNAAE